jgi:peptidoglycan/LPS O-acetylase OafA/YrhL
VNNGGSPPGRAVPVFAGRAAPAASMLSGDGFYLRQFDLFRTVTCVCVVAQHSVLWPVPGGASVGWGMVMVLHFTRNAFFFLSAFVAAYAQRTRPRRTLALWYRRISQILVPYLVWTAIYFVHSLIVTPMPSGPASTLWSDLWNGYYQLYFVVVLLQLYVLLPALLWLVRKTRGHHGAVLAGSFGFQIAMTVSSHYLSGGGVTGQMHQVAVDLFQPRLIVGYQLYLVMGLLAADHVDGVQRLVARHARAVVASTVVLFLVALGYYAYGLHIGQNPGEASDLYQPVACLWFVAAIAGLYALGWCWAERAARQPGRLLDRAVTWGSDLSGGIYFSHVLVLELVLSALGGLGLRTAVSWGVVSPVLFLCTLVLSATLVTLLLRSPLRWVLTGPNRTAERATLRWAPPPLAQLSGSARGAAPAPVAAG